jgi:uncharacterized protein (DUF1778 family)
MAQNATTTLQARLDPQSKRAVEEAARLRRIGLTDYVRLVLVATAKREVEQARQNVIQLTAQEQEKLWEALQDPPRPTKAQRKLAKMMRGED